MTIINEFKSKNKQILMTFSKNGKKRQKSLIYLQKFYLFYFNQIFNIKNVFFDIFIITYSILNKPNII